MTAKRGHRYGWIPDIPDCRDFAYKMAMPPKDLPAKVDLRANCSPVENQRALGSCTAQALVGVMEYNDKKPNGVWEDLSRLFVYYNERWIEGHVEYDAGAMLRTGIKTLAKQGVCIEKLWPYEIDKFDWAPPRKCYDEGAKHQIKEYSRIGYSINDMMDCLASRGPFVFGIPLYDSFESVFVSKTGKVPMPRKTERMLGGHAMMAVGYDRDKQFFIVRNSWGTEWGMAGYCEIPFEYLRTMAEDMWSVTK